MTDNRATAILPSGEKARGLNTDQAASLFKSNAGEDLSDNDYSNLEAIDTPEEEATPESDSLSLDEAADLLGERLAQSEPEPEAAPEPQHDDEPEVPAPQPHPARREIQEAAAQWTREAQTFDQVVAGVDWQRLKEMNPGEYAARMTELSERRNALQARAQAIRQANQQVSEQEQSLHIEHAQRLLAREEKKMVRAIPAWSNPTTREREKGQLREYLAKSGFSDQEIAGVTDHRVVKQVYQAWKAATGETERRVPRIPLKTRDRRSSPEALANREIRRRNVSDTSIDAAYVRLMHMQKGRGA